MIAEAQDPDKLFRQWKEEVRNILTVSKTGLEVRSLEQQLLDLTGRGIPFAAMGFQYLGDFLYECRDILDVHHYPHEDPLHCRTRFFLFIKASAVDNAEIHELVAGQRMHTGVTLRRADGTTNHPTRSQVVQCDPIYLKGLGGKGHVSTVEGGIGHGQSSGSRNNSSFPQQFQTNSSNSNPFAPTFGSQQFQPQLPFVFPATQPYIQYYQGPLIIYPPPIGPNGQPCQPPLILFPPAICPSFQTHPYQQQQQKPPLLPRPPCPFNLNQPYRQPQPLIPNPPTFQPQQQSQVSFTSNSSIPSVRQVSTSEHNHRDVSHFECDERNETETQNNTDGRDQHSTPVSSAPEPVQTQNSTSLSNRHNDELMWKSLQDTVKNLSAETATASPVSLSEQVKSLKSKSIPAPLPPVTAAPKPKPVPLMSLTPVVPAKLNFTRKPVPSPIKLPQARQSETPALETSGTSSKQRKPTSTLTVSRFRKTYSDSSSDSDSEPTSLHPGMERIRVKRVLAKIIPEKSENKLFFDRSKSYPLQTTNTKQGHLKPYLPSESEIRTTLFATPTPVAPSNQFNQENTQLAPETQELKVTNLCISLDELDGRSREERSRVEQIVSDGSATAVESRLNLEPTVTVTRRGRGRGRRIHPLPPPRQPSSSESDSEPSFRCPRLFRDAKTSTSQHLSSPSRLRLM